MIALVVVQWGVKIPLRDGVHLDATLYLPGARTARLPAVFTLTPYIAQTFHDQGMYFAERGYAFLTVDARGRGNSEGEFAPLINEGHDGYDVVEWIAAQEFCDQRVAMWGGSYAGFDQWAVAALAPPHLITIVPAAAAYIGVDFPMRCNISKPYVMQWLILVMGKTSQDKIFADRAFWSRRFREWFDSGIPFKELDRFLGYPSDIFQEWMGHPLRDAYWAKYNPSIEQYASLSIPVLTITGSYDSDQPGALMHYRQHVMSDARGSDSSHYLVIGPWDHAGTRTPVLQFCGLTMGAASLIDLPALHDEWYAWTLKGGPRPAFLRKKVAYYVMVADEWRYADTLEAITGRSEALYLHSSRNPTDVTCAGSLSARLPEGAWQDSYTYDPRDNSLAELEMSVDPDDRTDQRMILASAGKQLIYHSALFAKETDISGFFRLSVWLSIDQPDTDFRAWVYEIASDGTAVQLSMDSIRARYRTGLHEQKLIETAAPLRYDFDRFTFVSRRLPQGSYLRLVIGPINSIYSQKNYNSGRPVSEESLADARTVSVKLLHDPEHSSVLYVPLDHCSA